MRIGRLFGMLGVVFAAGLALAASAHGRDPDDLAPYKMIRSLQYV